MCTRKMEGNFSIDFNSNISRLVKQLFANYFVQENILQSKFKNKSNFQKAVLSFPTFFFERNILRYVTHVRGAAKNLSDNIQVIFRANFFMLAFHK